jgi:hypothetical protein
VPDFAARILASLEEGMRNTIATGTLLAALLCAAPIGSAHHSPAAFNTAVSDFTLKGTIELVEMRNPHSVMQLRVANDDGTSTLWDIEFSSVNLLLRRGWDFERIKVGDRVTCIGNPSAMGRNEMYMWSIVLADGTEFAR